MAVAYNTVASASGTTVSVTTTNPADHTSAGYAAIAAGDWEDIGLITAISGLPVENRPFNDTQTLDGITLTVRGTATMADINMTVAFAGAADPGQVFVEANANGISVVHFRVTLPNGVARYWASYVTGFGVTITDVQGLPTANFVVKPIFDQITGNGVVKLAA